MCDSVYYIRVFRDTENTEKSWKLKYKTVNMENHRKQHFATQKQQIFKKTIVL